MINAKTAYAKTKKSEAELYGHELNIVENTILDACSKGHSSVNVGGRLSNYTVNMLKDLGYEVKFTDDQRDGAWTSIEWWKGGDI